MTNSIRTQAVVVGSHISFLISILHINQLKESTTRRVQKLLLKGLKKGGSKDVQLSNESWKKVLVRLEEENLQFSSVTVVESLFFSFEPALTEYYGDTLSIALMNFINKHTPSNATEYAKDSYRLADELRDETRRVVFNA